MATIQQTYTLLKIAPDYKLAADQIQAGYVTSSGTKRASDLQLLADQKRVDDLKRQNDLDTKLAGINRGAPDGEKAVADAKALAETVQSFADKLYNLHQQKTLFDDVGPLEKWAREGVLSVGQVSDALETELSKGFDDLNSGIADAIANGKSLGDVFSSIFKTMEADLIRYLLKQSEIALVGDGKGATSILTTIAGLFGLGGTTTIPGHATGSDGFGGVTRLNEQGTEGVAFLPPNTQIIPNDVLRGLSKLDPSMLAPAPAANDLHVHIDVSGANGDAAVAAIARQAALEGTAQAIAYTNGRFASAASRQRNALGSRR